MTTRRERGLALFLFVAAAACGDDGTGGSGGGGLGKVDARCVSLCEEPDPACADDVAQCEPLCQVRVAGMSAQCASCLLDKSNSGTCSPGAPCCPDPEFPNGVVACASVCAGSAGVNPPGDHPTCADICSSSDAACAADATACREACQARIDGATGLCALCLLEGAHGGTCGSGGSCCPDATFPTDFSACASVCGG